MARKLAIIGSRGYAWLGEVERFVGLLKADTVVVSGGARGVDRTAARAARKRGMQVIELFADWNGLGRTAGMQRNRELVEQVDGLVAFWDGQSPGTQHAVTLAKKRGIWFQVRSYMGTLVEQGGSVGGK